VASLISTFPQFQLVSMDSGLFVLQPNGYFALFDHMVLDVQFQTDHIHVFDFYGNSSMERGNWRIYMCMWIHLFFSAMVP
jgi:hypothetical protein